MIPPRREFLKTSAAAAAAVLTSSSGLHAAIPDDQPIRVGFIGCGGMGTNHLKMLSQRRDVQLTWVCDVDTERLAAAAKIAEDGAGKVPQLTGELRKILADPVVDAVFIATLDHWHTPVEKKGQGVPG